MASVLAAIIMIVVMLAGGTVVGALLSPSAPASSPGVQTCPEATTVTIGASTYWSCNAKLDWSGVGFVPAELARVSFQRVLFAVYGYNTMDCDVVNVTGNESTGAAFAFLIYPIPLNCDMSQPTVFSTDGAVGATWDGGVTGATGGFGTIQLLVRSS